MGRLFVEKYQRFYWVTYPETLYKAVRTFHLITSNYLKMKKLLTVVLVGFLAACGSGSSSSKTDSTTVKTDSSTTTMSDSSRSMMDSTKMKMDSTKK
jgi:hypothetical protein